MTNLNDHIEEVFVISCSRCKHDGMSYADDRLGAETDFVRRGWTKEEVEGVFYTGVPGEFRVGPVMKVFCPMCNGKDRQV